jgi:hypothetical protein
MPQAQTVSINKMRGDAVIAMRGFLGRRSSPCSC